MQRAATAKIARRDDFTLEAWNESGRFFARVPHSGLPTLLNRYAGTVTAAGWKVVYRRTAAARLVSFARVRK